LGPADIITTAAQSSVMLVLPNGSLVALREKSRLKIAVALHSGAVALAANETGAEPREPGASHTGFELAFGEMLTRVRKLNPTSTFTVQTPVSVAAVRGTVFEVAYLPGASGEAQYRLSTSSGLVQVTPHGGQTVAVPADAQVDFTAEIGKGVIKIKQLKSGRLDRKKAEQLQTEALNHERNIGQLLARAADAGRGNPRNAVTDKVKPAADNRTDAPGRVTKPPVRPKPPPRVKPPPRPPRRAGT
jgi:hypothetical protein